MNLQSLKKLGARMALGALLTASLAASVVAPGASAHDWDRCHDGQPVRWAQPTTTHWWPSTWDPAYINAIIKSEENFNTSDFTYGRAESQSTAKVAWYNLNSADTSIAGAAGTYVNCTTHTITKGKLYLNFPHFKKYAHTPEQIQCTAIHEMAHIAGFQHNKLTSVLRTPHGTRCHTLQISTLQAHDYSDINGRY